MTDAAPEAEKGAEKDLEKDLAEQPYQAFSQVSSEVAIRLLLAAAAAYLCLPIYEPEFFGRLTVGRWILGTRQLPYSDHWTLLGQGREWIDASWLFDLSLAVADRLGGFAGLIVFKLVLTVIFLMVFYSVLLERSRSRALAVVLTLIGASANLVMAAFSPELVSWTLILFLANEMYETREGRGARWAFVFLASAVYANSHFSVLAVPVFLVISALGSKTKQPWTTASFIAALLLGFIVSPYFGAQVVQGASGALNSLLLAVDGRQAPTVFYYPFVFLMLLLALFFVYHQRAVDALCSGERLILFLMVLSACAVKQLIPFAVITVCFYTALLVGRSSAQDLGQVHQGVLLLASKLYRLPARGSVWFLTCLVIVLVMRLWTQPLNQGLLPVLEVDYILSEKLPGPVLHSADTGSYLMFRFSDQNGVPVRLATIDPRGIEYAPQAALEAAQCSDLGIAWERFVERVKPQTVLCRLSEPFCRSMQLRSDYYPVFRNRAALERKRDDDAPVEDQKSEQLKRLERVFGWAVFRKTPA